MTSRILIIDGDISLSTVLSDYLISRGYKAQRISDGKAGLEMLSDGHWDAVLMELQGIGMNGYEFPVPNTVSESARSLSIDALVLLSGLSEENFSCFEAQIGE